METNYNSNRVHIFVLILSQLTSNYQCDLDPALIQISRLKIKIRIKTVNIWKVWRILLPTVVYDSSTIDGNLPNISEGTIWSRSDNYRLSATQSDTIYWFEVFLKPFAKFSNCCLIVLLKKKAGNSQDCSRWRCEFPKVQCPTDWLLSPSWPILPGWLVLPSLVETI